jgi:hypothetical protein
MENIVEQFIEARQYLYDSLESKVECFLCGMWDPLMKFIIIKETNELVNRELIRMFPNLKPQYLPKVKFKMDEDEGAIEVGVQNYLNMEGDLTFLGVTEYGGIIYDFYIRESFDPNFEYIFYARNGHDPYEYEKGSKVPAAEYMMGMMTPLSIAYGFAIDEGFVA